MDRKNRAKQALQRLFSDFTGTGKSLFDGGRKFFLLVGESVAWDLCTWVASAWRADDLKTLTVRFQPSGSQQRSEESKTATELDFSEFREELSMAIVLREYKRLAKDAKGTPSLLVLPLTDLVKHLGDKRASLSQILSQIRYESSESQWFLIHVNPKESDLAELRILIGLTDHAAEVAVAQGEWSAPWEVFLSTMSLDQRLPKWVSAVTVQGGEPVFLSNLQSAELSKLAADWLEKEPEGGNKDETNAFEEQMYEALGNPFEQRSERLLQSEMEVACQIAGVERSENESVAANPKFFRFGFAGLDGYMTRRDQEQKQIVSGFMQAYAIGVECEAPTLAITPWLTRVVLQGIKDQRRFVIISFDDTPESFINQIYETSRTGHYYIRRAFESQSILYVAERMERTSGWFQTNDNVKEVIFEESPKNPTLFAGQIRKAIRKARSLCKEGETNIGPVIIMNSYSTLSSLIGEDAAYALLQDILRRELWDTGEREITAMLLLYQKGVLDQRAETRLRQTVDGIVHLVEREHFGTRRLYHRMERIPNLMVAGAWYPVHTIPELGCSTLEPRIMKNIMKAEKIPLLLQ